MLQGYVGVPLDWLVVGFNPSEKYARQNGFIFTNFRGENKKYLKPPLSFRFFLKKPKDPIVF